MKQITKQISRKTLEAGLFLSAVALPSGVFAQGAEGGLFGGARRADDDDTLASGFFEPDGTFNNIINTLLFLIGAISVVMLIIGGFRYVVSGGDSGQVESAKNTILYAIIGIVIAFLAFAAVEFVLSSLGAEA